MSFLVVPVEKSVNGQLRGPSLDIEDAVVRLSEAGGIEFRLKNVRLYDQGGVVVAEAPFASVGLSASALLTGKLAAGSVDLIGPRVLLHVTEDEGVCPHRGCPNGCSPHGAAGARHGPAIRVRAMMRANAGIALGPAINQLFQDLAPARSSNLLPDQLRYPDAEFFVARHDRVTRWQVRNSVSSWSGVNDRAC